MQQPNANEHASMERTSIPGRWPGASLYKSIMLGWRWPRLKWAVVAASEAAQGHEANGLAPGSRESKTLFNEAAGKVEKYTTESGAPLDTLKARLQALCAPTVHQNEAGMTIGILIAALMGEIGIGALIGPATGIIQSIANLE